MTTGDAGRWSARTGQDRRRAHRLAPRLTGAATVLLCGTLVAACSGSAGGQSSSTIRSRPAGPAADLSHEITPGNGAFVGSATAVDLGHAGYVQHEYVASGSATSYDQKGTLTGDGRWSFAPAGRAPYRTRVLVRRPANPSRFSGTVVVEWLNVSAGIDADPEWTSLHEEILRRGDAWVGVSAQRIGVMGGPVLVKVEGVAGADLAGKGLRAIDPARYGSLDHPGDGFSFDIYTQIAQAIRGRAVLGGQQPRRMIAAGESQSAFALVTYYDGVQPLTQAFDGFFVHSRGAVGLPLVGPGKYADIAGAISGTAAIFRTDQRAPVLDVQSETDVTSILNSFAARQPDNDRFRLWEVVGTAHADAHLLGSTAGAIDCGVPINNGPLHLVAKAALRALTTWIQSAKTPVTAPRISVAPGTTPQIRRDPDGIALGGIRTPPVDVPIAALSGVPGPHPSTICLLLGSTGSFSAAHLAQRYPSRVAYLQRYDADADTTIRAGFVLGEDRGALLGFADPSMVTS